MDNLRDIVAIMNNAGTRINSPDCGDDQARVAVQGVFRYS